MLQVIYCQLQFIHLPVSHSRADCVNVQYLLLEATFTVVRY